MTILVVEDDLNVLAFIDRLLTQRGDTVVGAGDPDHARFLLAEHGTQPDLLLLDVVLPGSNGLDFARAVKTANPSLKIVFMTGLMHRAPAVQRSGLGPVIHKPFTSEELIKVIDSQ